MHGFLADCLPLRRHGRARGDPRLLVCTCRAASRERCGPPPAATVEAKPTGTSEPQTTAVAATPTPTPARTPAPTPVPMSARASASPPPPATRAAVEIARGNTSGRDIAFTFDCAANSGPTQEILDVLTQENVSVTFFMVGIWARDHQDLTKQIALRHELANHSWRTRTTETSRTRRSSPTSSRTRRTTSRSPASR